MGVQCKDVQVGVLKANKPNLAHQRVVPEALKFFHMTLGQNHLFGGGMHSAGNRSILFCDLLRPTMLLAIMRTTSRCSTKGKGMQTPGSITTRDRRIILNPLRRGGLRSPA